MGVRLGVDFGGTKIEAAALAPDGAMLARRRVPNPGSYDAAIAATRGLLDVISVETRAQGRPVGVAIPGSENPDTRLIRNANSTWLNGRPFAADLAAALDRPVRLANDANCFALSEAADGAAAGKSPVFGVIVGTGCGGGLVVGGALVNGANGIAGEWGHTPLPWPDPAETPGPACWCGHHGCLETWLSGPALSADHAAACREVLPAEEIAAHAEAGDPGAAASIARYKSRLARALAMVANLLDPQAVVLGGGVSNIAALYDGLDAMIADYAFTDAYRLDVLRNAHGDSSGVRGAAWLWGVEETG